jgi:6-phosphogluconolactonase (cycloisomerase 2 family)
MRVARGALRPLHSKDSSPSTQGRMLTAFSNRSAYSVIGLGENGAMNGPLQIVFPKLATPGPVALRQDLSYLHEVLIDPSKKYILMNDLGADLVRVFSWDKKTLAPLTELASMYTEPGVGPRHGVFWNSPSGVLYYFFVGELSQNVYSYQIHYNATGGMYWTKIFQIPALGLGNSRPAQTSPVSEIALSPDNKFIIVSNRDVSFPQSTIYASGPTDTISTFSIHGNGSLSLVQLAPSGGWSPRQFSLNKKGDLIAIGHQGNKSVIVWKRDVASGKIDTSAPVGNVTLTGAVVATIWDECD